MNSRLLARSENAGTRELWEEVFAEDTKAFLDYYYQSVAKHNYIYGIEEEGEICSMLHLNPYQMNINEKQYLLHYIVAVSTKERCRGRGYMRQLLKNSFKDMYDRRELFTYLMPAKEAIYEPFDFVTVSDQTHYKIGKKEFFLQLESQFSGYEIRKATKEDCIELAQFAQEKIARKFEVYTTRTAQYFGKLIKEQECQHGGIYILLQDQVLRGYFLFAEEGYAQVRELVLEKNVNLRLDEEEKPKIMVRPIYMEAFLDEFMEAAEVHVIDEILTENTGVYINEKNSGGGFKKVEKEIDREKALSIKELTKQCLEKKKILINEIV